MGTLITEPSMSYLPSGIAMTKFRMQTRNDGQYNRPPDEHSITVFGKKDDPQDGLAGWAAQHLKPGTLIVLQARHGEKEFQGQNGKKFYNCQIVAFSISIVSNESS